MFTWAAEAPAEAPAEEKVSSEYYTQCAWCGSIGKGHKLAGNKRPLVHRLGSRLVSHGICPSCYDAVLSSLTGGGPKRAAPVAG